MIVKIWRVLAQILFYRRDSIKVVKPFFENLKNETINDKKFIPVLQTFSPNQLEVLYENGIITEEIINSFLPKNRFIIEKTNFKVNDISSKIEEIISGDNLIELEKFLQEKDIKTLNMIIKSFVEVKKMKIPLIQYCIMKNAIECFKYLLVNGFDDPNRIMEEQNPEFFFDSQSNKIEIKRYEWDCMATAIYYGNKEIIQILEVKGIEKGKNPAHIEAAILSYRNLIAKQLIEDRNENHEEIQSFLNPSLIISVKNNNIKGFEFLMTKGVDINTHDKRLNSF